MTCTFIDETGEARFLDLTSVPDDAYAKTRDFYVTRFEDVSFDGLFDVNHIPDMVPGYVYVVKNRKNK